MADPYLKTEYWNLTNEELINKHILFLKNKPKKKESKVLEFKSNWDLDTTKTSDPLDNLPDYQPDNILKHRCIRAIAAFANTEGGHLIIGLDDDGEPIKTTDKDGKKHTLGILDNSKYKNEPEKLEMSITRTLQNLPEGSGWDKITISNLLEIKISNIKSDICKCHPNPTICRINIRFSPTKPLFIPEINYKTEVINSNKLIFVIRLLEGGTQTLNAAQQHTYLQQRRDEYKPSLILNSDPPDNIKQKYQKIIDKFNNQDYDNVVLDAYRILRPIMEKRILDIDTEPYHKSNHKHQIHDLIISFFPTLLIGYWTTQFLSSGGGGIPYIIKTWSFLELTLFFTISVFYFLLFWLLTFTITSLFFHSIKNHTLSSSFETTENRRWGFDIANTLYDIQSLQKYISAKKPFTIKLNKSSRIRGYVPSGTITGKNFGIHDMHPYLHQLSKINLAETAFINELNNNTQLSLSNHKIKKEIARKTIQDLSYFIDNTYKN